jgi:hypothetical protein
VNSMAGPTDVGAFVDRRIMADAWDISGATSMLPAFTLSNLTEASVSVRLVSLQHPDRYVLLRRNTPLVGCAALAASASMTCFCSTPFSSNVPKG